MLDSDSVKTEKIYYADAYAVRFTAEVISSGGMRTLSVLRLK